MLHNRMKEVGDSIIYGTVEKVDESARTCDVKVGGITYEGVLLYALEKDELKGFTFIPKQGSGVLLARVGMSSRHFIEMFSEIDKVLVTIGDNIEVVISAKGMTVKAENALLQAAVDGFKMTRDGSGLKKTLANLCDAIGRITVPTNVGASSTPINIAEFKAIKDDLNNYLS